jgi:hypothetical protein
MAMNEEWKAQIIFIDSRSRGAEAYCLLVGTAEFDFSRPSAISFRLTIEKEA